jgi:mRNA interferase MazF
MTVERWSIWQASLDPVVGSEQGKTRPVLIVSDTALNDVLPVINVIPLTSRKPGRRIYPNETLLTSGVGGLTDDSLVLCYQIRTLDKRRLGRLYGKLDDVPLQEQVLTALCFQLAIAR